MKIKALSIIILVLLCVSGASGQDIIKKHNGETIEVFIVDISPGVIKYRKFDKPHGSVYSIARDQVEKITYQNGKTVSFEEEEEEYEDLMMVDESNVDGSEMYKLEVYFRTPEVDDAKRMLENVMRSEFNIARAMLNKIVTK